MNLPSLGCTYGLNDEVHTDAKERYIFSHEQGDTLEEEGSENDCKEALRFATRIVHRALKEYVLDSYLYYVLLHTERVSEFASFLVVAGRDLVCGAIW